LCCWFVCLFFFAWFHFLLVLCGSLLLCHDQRDFVY
jgi:hypothetical protein